MIKVVYLVSTLKRSGPTNQLYNLIKYLDRSKFQPLLITLSPEVVDTRWSEFENLGIDLRSLDLSRLAGAFLAKKKLSKLIREIKPDLVHTQGLRSDVLSARTNGDYSTLATIRNFPQVDYPMTYGSLQGRLMANHHAGKLSKINKCIGVSEAVSENLRNLYGLKNVATIKNGVDEDIYHPVDHSSRMLLREKLDLPLNREVWICSGHLAPRKSPLLLIDAWMKSSFFKDKQLVFIGSGELHEQCLSAAQGCANIRLAGRVANVVEYLQASDYYISASQAEGLPNSVLEGLACGLPVVLSDIGPHREIWEMSPDVGKIFDLNSGASLVAAIQAQCADDRAKASEAALELIHGRLSARVMSQEYQSIYASLT